MKIEQNNSNNSGLGFFGLLTIIFITLKLLGYISWSWWWVLLPLWGTTLLVLVVFLVTLLWAMNSDRRKNERV